MPITTGRQRGHLRQKPAKRPLSTCRSRAICHYPLVELSLATCRSRTRDSIIHLSKFESRSLSTCRNCHYPFVEVGLPSTIHLSKLPLSTCRSRAIFHYSLVKIGRQDAVQHGICHRPLMMIIKSFFLFLKRLINNRGNNGMAEIQPAISRRGVINQPDRRASHSGSSTGPQQARFPNRSRKTLRSPLHGAPMSRRWHTGTERQAHFHGPGQKNGDKPGHPCCPPTVKRLPPSVIKSRTRRHHWQDKPPQGARVEPATSLTDRLTRGSKAGRGLNRAFQILL
ncbi:hypothetical protein Deipr_2724 (plasmid) [Deinococcus proteolyticus MRP]|uniref:Uncharacterized protein n=1 Tax=Deinococcus proteolyticus (strain ATCC 35074 / DSM 20540 / JCM 6276 / NBRC 101906 / NCIMB 13154 / VKM Ac-1939 / CCM 2703 / MRP) TaxID=693977 RepID=F0RRB1_DEIPM|nr:hypothetical protein Deipr_2724 [Deinococcus proteolyticus MRP]